MQTFFGEDLYLNALKEEKWLIHTRHAVAPFVFEKKRHDVAAQIKGPYFNYVSTFLSIFDHVVYVFYIGSIY